MFINSVFEQGLAAHRQGDLVTAQECYQQVLQQQPQHADALHLSGVLAKQLNAADIGVDMIKKAIAINPVSSAYYNNLALCYRDMGDNRNALAVLQQAVQLNPEDAMAWFNLGNVERDMGERGAAISAYQTSLQHQPKNTAALNNLGELLYKQGLFAEAEQQLQKALVLEPGLQQAHANLGHVYRRLKHFPEALQHYRQALAANARDFDSLFGTALVELQQEDYPAGWDKYQARFFATEKIRYRHPELQAWPGIGHDGRVLVWAEQGVGDEIMFASLLPVLAQHVSAMTLECDERLMPLFLQALPALHTVAKDSLDDAATVQQFDYQLPLGDLPRLLGFPQTVGNNGRFLAAGQPADASGPLRIGISWISRNADTGHLRSIAFEQLAPLFKQPGTAWVNLQFGDCTAEAEWLAAQGVCWEDDPGYDKYTELEKLADTIRGLNLVICVDNSVAHLSAALGVETWILLNRYSDWRWGAEREDSIWYPSVTLLRQQQAGDWQPVISRVQQRLQQTQELVREKSHTVE